MDLLMEGERLLLRRASRPKENWSESDGHPRGGISLEVQPCFRRE